MMYQIDPQGYNSIGVRKSLGFTLPFLVVIILLFLGLSRLANDPTQMLLDLIGKSTFFWLIVGYIFGMLWYQNRNLTKATLFEITPDYIGKITRKDKLNFGNKMGVAKSQVQYGAKSSQMIFKNEIDSIKIKKSYIRIRSNRYNWFNGNGQIEIPKEIENYTELVAHFENLKKELRLG